MTCCPAHASHGVVILDTARLSKVRPGPAGSIFVPARIGRSGVQVYRRQDGTTVRAFRPPDEVFRADYTGTPVTVGHPPAGVTADTWQQLAVGHVARQDAAEVIGADYFVPAQLQVTVAGAVSDVVSGQLAELSCAYDADQDWTPGKTPAGDEYDVIFRNIVPNHVALLPPGQARAGRDAKILLDGVTMILDDNTAPVPPPAPLAPPAQTPQVTLTIDQATALITDSQRLQASLAAAQDTIGKLQARVAELPKLVADGVAAELAFRARLATALPKDFDFAGKTRQDVLRAAILARDPQAQLVADASEVWLEAYFAGQSAAAPAPALHDHNKDVANPQPPPAANAANFIADESRKLWSSLQK